MWFGIGCVPTIWDVKSTKKPARNEKSKKSRKQSRNFNHNLVHFNNKLVLEEFWENFFGGTQKYFIFDHAQGAPDLFADCKGHKLWRVPLARRALMLKQFSYKTVKERMRNFLRPKTRYLVQYSLSTNNLKK